MTAHTAAQTESFWVQRLASGAGFCCLLGAGPGQAIEGFWREVFGATRPGSSVLEIGCGSGEVAVWAAEAGRRLRIVASDLHDRPELVRQHPDVSFLCHARAEALPVEAGSFDMVVSNFAFEYAADRGAAAAELARVLRPGGSAALVLHSGDSAVSASSRDLLRVHDQLLRAEIPDRVRGAASLRPDHLTRRKLLKDVLKLKPTFPTSPTGLSGAVYFDVAERLLRRDPAARQDLESLDGVVARLVEMSVAQLGAALDRNALAELARVFAALGMEVHTSELSGTYDTGAVQKVAWLALLTKTPR